ncbi:type II secretion system protein GspM [Limnohabitans sp.]|jgi:general secretion pathway protein M|uniref:type II secretion system protein GspM n=1 Tax=Limnohabitans sp. TaxID=1907725 RepID=UPI00286F9FD3|nr:type II secretion system protein GspM [Limnohabitans sp.]
MKALRAQTLSRWQALSPREQRGVSVLGALLGVWLFWSIAIAPALNTLRDSDNRRAQIGQQQAHMLALQHQAQALQTRTPLSRDEALRSLQSLTPGALMQLNVQGDRVSVQLKSVPAPTLANWLTQARSQAQALPVEAHLTRSNAANSAVVWDGSLVLSLPTRGAAAR